MRPWPSKGLLRKVLLIIFHSKNLYFYVCNGLYKYIHIMWRKIIFEHVKMRIESMNSYAWIILSKHMPFCYVTWSGNVSVKTSYVSNDSCYLLAGYMFRIETIALATSSHVAEGKVRESPLFPVLWFPCLASVFTLEDCEEVHAQKFSIQPVNFPHLLR